MIHDADVPRGKPAIDEALCGGFWPVPIACEDCIATDHNLTGLALRDVKSLLVDEPDISAYEWST